MNRRRMGRGRRIAAVGAAIVLVGCVPAWYTVGGEALPALSRNAFDGAGIVVFITAIALLALLALPYAAGDQPVAVDRPISYVVLAIVGGVGFALRLLQLGQSGALGPSTSMPDRAPGLWIAALGLVVVAWGVIQIVGERQPR